MGTTGLIGLGARCGRRVWSADGALGLVATLFGLVSLWYPFGRDQGLFFYAAREWLERGQVLYRDVWDHKPPVIYLIHMMAIGVFGENMWAIRVIELFVAIPLIAWAAARLATPQGERPQVGLMGAAWVLIAVVYFGLFNFWDSAQCEIWVAVFVILGLVAIQRGTHSTRSYVLGGVLTGLALFAKVPAVTFVPVLLGAVIVRTSQTEPRRWPIVRSIVRFGVGGCAVAALILGYFSLVGGLDEMFDILVGANSTYLRDEAKVSGLSDIITATIGTLRLMNPVLPIILLVPLVAMAIAYHKRDRVAALRWVLPLSLLVASYLSVVMQKKFFIYHWGTLVAGVGLVGVNAYQALARVSSPRVKPWLVRLIWIAIVLIPFAANGSAGRWYADVRATIAFERGSITRPEFNQRFNIRIQSFDYEETEEIGNWLRDHVRPGDTVVIRGFEPQIYAICGCWFTGRFYWTSFLVQPTRIYRRKELLAEDLLEILRHPPRFAVALRIGGSVDSPRWFEWLGYVRVFQTPEFIVLQAPATLRVAPP